MKKRFPSISQTRLGITAETTFMIIETSSRKKCRHMSEANCGMMRQVKHETRQS